MYIATNKDDFMCQTKSEAESIIQNSALNPYDDIWISQAANEYPCLSILVNGTHACVHYFLNDSGDMWQSAGNLERDILFAVNGEAPSPMPGNCVIPLEQAITCMRLFFDTPQKPDCIEWREL